MWPVEYYPLLVKKKLSNLVHSTEQDHYSRRAYVWVQNYIGVARFEFHTWLVGNLMQCQLFLLI